MIETLASIVSLNRNIVEVDTWGHLAPKKNITYRGWIKFAVSAYNSSRRYIIDIEIEGLNDSPWLYDAIYKYINNLEGGIVTGYYKLSVTFRNYRIWGKIVDFKQ